MRVRVRVRIIDKNGQDRTSKTRQSKRQDKTARQRQDTKTYKDGRLCLGQNQSQRQTGTKTKSKEIKGRREGCLGCLSMSTSRSMSTSCLVLSLSLVCLYATMSTRCVNNISKCDGD